MEAFKLINFKKANNAEMPIVRSMQGGECEAFFEMEEREAVLLDGMNAENDDFNWNRVFDSIGIAVPHEVYINFGRFESIDVFLFEDFCNYFDDIWYPVVDDMEVFDATLTWLVSVRHYGAVFYKKI